jgi:hypothetical protein
MIHDLTSFVVIGLFDGSAVEEWPCFNDDDDVMKMLHS